ncbi:MAG: hypothetical protein JSW34_06400 [Candidatus Zixiibacteriota bacterium]|nr:MAG: hypothetical protein JSW34_06400 [candidate division Zixibacteria bacterium]
MNAMKLIMPVALLIAAVALGCNQSDDSAVPGMAVNPSAALASATEVTIDIQPHNPGSRINCTAKNRLIAVGIITTDDFDALDVDHTTVEFEGATEAHVEGGVVERHELDVDNDGDLDLIFHFRLAKTDLDCSSTSATLTGYTWDNEYIYGTDAVHMFGG